MSKNCEQLWKTQNFNFSDNQAYIVSYWFNFREHAKNTKHTTAPKIHIQPALLWVQFVCLIQSFLHFLCSFLRSLVEDGRAPHQRVRWMRRIAAIGCGAAWRGRHCAARLAHRGHGPAFFKHVSAQHTVVVVLVLVVVMLVMVMMAVVDAALAALVHIRRLHLDLRPQRWVAGSASGCTERHSSRWFYPSLPSSLVGRVVFGAHFRFSRMIRQQIFFFTHQIQRICAVATHRSPNIGVIVWTHLSPVACGEGSPSNADVNLSPWAPRTPMGSAWSPDARSASGSSLTGKEMSFMGSSLIRGGLQSSRAFSGFTSRSYSSDSSLLTWWRKTRPSQSRPLSCLSS